MVERAIGPVFDLPRLTWAQDAGLAGITAPMPDRVLLRAVEEAMCAAADSVGAEPMCAYVAALGVLLRRYSHDDGPIGELRLRYRGQRQRGDWLRLTCGPTDTFADVIVAVRSALASAHRDESIGDRPEYVMEPAPASSPLTRAAVEFWWNVEPTAAAVPEGSSSLVVAVDDTKSGIVQVRVLGPQSSAQLVAAVEADYVRVLEAVVGESGPVAEIEVFAATGQPPAVSGITYRGLRLDEIVEAHARRSPEAIAVRAATEISYAELVRRSRRLCTALESRGVGIEARVGVCVARDERVAVAILGILMAGAAFVPLAPEDPRARRKQMMRDAGIAVVVTHDELAADVADVAGIVRLEECDHLEEAEPVRSSDAAAAYVLYTSGSTGRPKGVVVEHRQLTSYVSGVLDRLGIDRPLTCAMVQPLTVDSSLTCIGAAWVSGGELQILDRATGLDLGRLTAWNQAHRPDLLKIAPSHLRALQTAGDYAAAMPALALVVGGEASDWSWLQRTQDDLPCAVYNHYGPTETTVGVTMLRVSDHQGRSWTMAAVGRPLAGCEVVVVDRFGMTAPAGVTGELVIRGRLVARGYQTVPPDSGFRPWQGVAAYWTGDHGLCEADGVVCFAGRADDQVKIRGFRVELGEVERAVDAHPQVTQAIAVVLPDRRGDTSLGCVIQTSAAGKKLTPDLLAAHCRAQLPEQMIPSTWAFVTQLPVTPHGKVDRRAVVELLTGLARSAESRHAPAVSPTARTVSTEGPDLETTVTEIWCEILGRRSVDPLQNFFDAGGHSLLLLDLQRSIENRTGRAVELLDLFQHTTITAQIELLRDGSRSRAPRREDEGRQRRLEALARRRQQRKRSSSS